MTAPTVVQSTVTHDTSGTINVTPSYMTGMAAGNTLICLVRKSVQANNAFTWPAGWTEFFANSADGSDDRTAFGWRKVVGNETGFFTITGTGTGKWATIQYEISGATDPSVTPPEVSAGATGASAAPDPDTVTPSGGAKDYLFFAVAAYEGEQTNPPTFPTGYTTNQVSDDTAVAGAVATNCRISAASKATTAATSENPGTYTISVSDDWTAATIAVYPTTGGGGVTLVKKAFERGLYRGLERGMRH